MSTIDGITIPDDVEWVDEFTSWKVGQVQRFSLTGSLIVHESSRQAGRPITLESGPEVWVTLDTVNALLASEASGAGPFDVVMPAHNSGTRTVSCIWRRDGGNAVVARPIRYMAPFENGDRFAITLRLTQVD